MRKWLIYIWLLCSCVWAQSPGLTSGGSSTPGAPSPAAVPDNRSVKNLLSQDATRALQSGRISLNYENMDMRLLARLMGEITDRNILVDHRFNGQMTVYSASPVPVSEAWQIYVRALEKYGYSVVDKSGYTAIVPIKEAMIERGAGYQHALLMFDNVDVQAALETFKAFLTPNGTIAIYPGGRAVVVVDRADVVQKIKAVGKQLDAIQGRSGLEVFYPKYALAKDIYPVFSTMLVQQQSQTGVPSTIPGPTVQLFEAGNALVVRGNKEQIAFCKTLLKKIDLPGAAPPVVEEPEFFVVSLKYARAEEISKILTQMLSERKSGQEQVDQIRKQEQIVAATQVTNGSVPPAATAPSTNNTVDNPNERRTGSFVSSQVAFDNDTNSLVFYLSPKEFQEIQKLLTVLDQPRKQILIAAVVAEVSLTKLLETGIRFQGLSSSGILSSLNGGLSESGLLNYLTSGNYIVGVAGGGNRTINVDGTATQVPEFLTLLQANNNRRDFNLISSPRLMSQDHKEAEFLVGDVVPFATGARFDNNGQPLITYDYRDVGVKMKVTPHISGSDTIRIELDQQVQEVTDFLEQDMGSFGYVVPLISTRSIKTELSAKDGQTLMIGGLISKRTIETMSKVPLLGDLPLIGKLFTNKRKEDKKTTLFISLTPYIVDSPEEIDKLNQPYAQYLDGEEPKLESLEPIESPYAEEGVVIQELDLEKQLKLKQPTLVHASVLNKTFAVRVVRCKLSIVGPTTQQLESGVLEFGKGASRKISFPPYIYPKSGRYTVKMTVIDADSQELLATSSQEVVVKP